MGHEIEVQAAAAVYGRDAATYRAAEARAMVRGYDGMFAGWTEARIIAAMETRSAKAARWVSRNLSRILDKR